jgi:hypothetical protein
MNILVIGGCNVDFISKAENESHFGTSNIADISADGCKALCCFDMYGR